MTRTCLCSAPTREHGYVCDTCLKAYETDLGDIPGLAEDMTVTLTRQARVTRRVGSRSTIVPLPFSWPASVAFGTLHNTLHAWVSEIRGHHRDIPEHPLAQCGYLLTHRDWPRVHELGPQLVDEIGYLHHELRRVVDQPAPRWYAGPCGNVGYTLDLVDQNGTMIFGPAREVRCDEALYAHPDAEVITCPGCGTSHQATARRAWLLQAAQDALAPLELIHDALPALVGVAPPWAVVRRWPARTGARQLPVRGLTRDGVELFRVADVLDLARSYHARRLHVAK